MSVVLPLSKDVQMELNKRIQRLEGLRRPHKAESRPSPDRDEFVRKLDRMKAAWAVEDKRRKALPIEEQIGPVKADREAARRDSAPRSPIGARPSLDAFRDRLVEVQIRELEKRIRERDAVVRD